MLLALRVCDPAIGEGAFLVEIVARARRSDSCARRAPRRVASAASRRRHRSARRRRGARGRRRASSVPACLRCASTCASAMRSDRLAAGSTRSSRIRRTCGRSCSRTKPALRRFASYDGVADLYVYFVELAHRIAPAATASIVPNKWMTAAYGRPLRELLAREQQRRRHRRFRARLPLFGDADAFPCIVWGSAASAPDRSARLASRDRRASPMRSPRRRSSTRASAWQSRAVAHRRSPTTPRCSIGSPRAGRRSRDVVPERPSRGVVTGCNRAFVIDARRATRCSPTSPRPLR